MTLENKIESILFFKNEPVTLGELSKLLGESIESVKQAVQNLQKEHENRGVVIITDGELVSFGTHPDASALIETIQKEELSRELGRAGLETLSIILYKAPISKREIDYIRGVSSGFILRNLLVRGLIERVDPSTDSGQAAAGRSYSYKPTLKLFEHLGITKIEELPEYDTAFKKMEEFVKEKQEEDIAETE